LQNLLAGIVCLPWHTSVATILAFAEADDAPVERLRKELGL
jgi:hypothetical protein